MNALIHPFAILYLIVALVTQAAAQSDFADERRYQDCMVQAQKDPNRGMDEAFQWRAEGGGPPALHCLAASLFGIAHFEDSAQIFEEAAQDLRAGRGFSLPGMTEETVPEVLAGLQQQAGNAWLLAGDAIKAHGALSQALIDAPRDSPVRADLYIDRARASAEAGDIQAAIEDLDEAAELSPDRAEVFIYRASANRLFGNYEAATFDVNKALALAPQDREALLERGNLRRLMGADAGARRDWSTVARLYPDTEAADAARANLEKLDLENRGTEIEDAPEASEDQDENS